MTESARAMTMSERGFQVRKHDEAELFALVGDPGGG